MTKEKKEEIKEKVTLWTIGTIMFILLFASLMFMPIEK